ncbi:MAG: hypothetical protein ABIQ12_09540 [Opitutaceae bacterium]
MRTTISWSALTLAVILAGVAFWAMRTKIATERRLAAARAEGERLGAAWRASQQRPIASETAVPASASAATTPATEVKPAFPPRAQAPGLTDLARDNPQLWNEFIHAKRIEMGRFYAPVMQRLALTPAQRERVKDILGPVNTK